MADYSAELNQPVPEGLVNTNKIAWALLLDWLARFAPLELPMQDCLGHLQSVNMVPPCTSVLTLNDVLARSRCFVVG